MNYKTILQSTFLVLVLLSCRNSDKNIEQGTEAPITYNSIYENPSYVRVYNEYVTYLNDITSSYDVPQTYYFNAFPGDYPKKIERIPNLVTIKDYPDNHLEKAIKADLKIESLEKAAQPVNETISTLRNLINLAEGYYSRQEYLDDNAKRGKILHDSIVPAFSSLHNAIDNFRNKITDIEGKMTLAELENYKKENLKLRYSFLKIITIARETRAFTQVETMDEFANIDIEKVIDVRQRLSNIVKELETIAADESQFEREFGTISIAASSYNFGFKRASNDLIRQLRKLEDRIKNNEFEPEIPNNTPSSIRKMMEDRFYKGAGMPQSIMNNEAELIDAYNSIIN